MLKYVNECDVSVVDSFMKKAPRDVREAVQHTAGSTTGSLPWAYFEVNVVTIGENLKSLMHSVIMSGYVMRIVVDELDMQFGVEQAMPDAVDNSESTQPARAGHRPWDDGFAPVRLMSLSCSFLFRCCCELMFVHIETCLSVNPRAQRVLMTSTSSRTAWGME
jgi:Protein of unknown function (DUF760)